MEARQIGDDPFVQQALTFVRRQLLQFGGRPDPVLSILTTVPIAMGREADDLASRVAQSLAIWLRLLSPKA